MVTKRFSSAEQPASDQLEPDKLLDRLRLATLGAYDVAGELGRGGMAVVYVARDLQLERLVAIKVMDPRLGMIAGMANRFLLEARIAARLSHPNVIVVHEVVQSHDISFFVMMLVRGGGLDEVLQLAHPMKIEHACWIVSQAAGALAYAHSEDVVHRDVKPANILINVKGDVILTDFGIAKAVDSGTVTKSGTQIGTPLYMSPEQFASGPIGPASDQYALGVTAYELLTGVPPFAGELYQLVVAHGTQTPTHIRTLRPDCPAFLANAVMRMLEKRPDDRWPSLDDVRDVLSANLPLNGANVRRELAGLASIVQADRTESIPALSARTPISPIPLSTRRENLVVRLSPPAATVFIGGELTLAATVATDVGEPVVDPAVSWTSSDPRVVVVKSGGSITGVAEGVAVVRASVERSWGEATIRVDPAPVARLSLDKPTLTLRVGDTECPVVTAVDVNGAARPDVPFAWISRSPAIADLDAPGRICARAPGQAIVEVSSGSARRYLEVTVLPRPVETLRIRPVQRRLELGGRAALVVDAVDDREGIITTPQVKWRSSAPAVIHVDAHGSLMAVAPGVAQITAEVDGVSDSIELEAVEAPVGRFELTLADAEVEVGDEVQIGLRVWDSEGAPRSMAGLRLSASAPAVATLDADRLVLRAIGAGDTTITAAVDTRDGEPALAQHVHLRVHAASIARIDVRPSSLDLEAGSIGSITARCVDRRGRVAADARVTFGSSNADAVTVDENGTVRARTAGSAVVTVTTIDARGQQVDARVPVRVRHAPVARLAFSSAQTAVVVDESLQLNVRAFDLAGDELPAFTAEWHSSDVSVARVDTAGRVHAVAPGIVSIVATSEAAAANVELRVVPVPLRRLEIQLSTPHAVTGVPLQLLVHAEDRTGRPATPKLSWSVEPFERASISGDGRITPLVAGVLTVTACLDPTPDRTGVAARDDAGAVTGVQRASIRLEVGDPRVTVLQVVPASLTLRVGERRVLHASGVLETGEPAPTNEVVWSSSDDRVARVIASREVEACGEGDATLHARLDDIEATAMLRVSAKPAPRRLRAPLLMAGGVVAVAIALFVVLRDSPRATQPTVAPPQVASTGRNTTTAAPTPTTTSTSTSTGTLQDSAGGAADSGSATGIVGAPATGTTGPGQSPPSNADVPTGAVAPLSKRDSAARAAGATPGRRGANAATPSQPRTPTTPPPAFGPEQPMVTTPVITEPKEVVEALTPADVDSAARRVVASIQNDGTHSVLEDFYKDGSGHRRVLTSTPVTQPGEGGSMQAQVYVQFSRSRAVVGRVNWIAPVTFDVTRRNGTIEVANIKVGPLQRQ